MNALVLTEELAGELEAVNAGSALRKVEPRRLGDGRLIVNADLLGDGSAEPWRGILERGSAAVVTEEEMG